jgi:hypothetical protein
MANLINTPIAKGFICRIRNETLKSLPLSIKLFTTSGCENPQILGD